MTNFRPRLLRREIPLRVKNDIRSFFGDVNRAQGKAQDLLFAAGDPDELELALDELDYGVFDRDQMHFTFHRSLLPKLPPILRVYVGCGSIRYGDPEEADLIKIHVNSRKVTFLRYDDFARKPLPELQQRIKVNLRTRFVQVFDHSNEGQLLYFKERFMMAESSNKQQLAFSARLKQFGILPGGSFRPSEREFNLLRTKLGLTRDLRRKRNPRLSASSSECTDT